LAPDAQAAIAAARSEAERLGGTYFGPKHLLLAVLSLPQCGAVNVLARLGVNSEAVQRGLQLRADTEGVQQSGVDYSNTIRAHKLLEFATDKADELKKPGYSCVRTEHLLLGILNETDSLPAQVLHELGVTAKQVRRVIAQSGGWAMGRD
jgi:ATP-dependent Clp protease ATP-binding subunit ClpA